jgi:hypothetical protein
VKTKNDIAKTISFVIENRITKALELLDISSCSHRDSIEKNLAEAIDILRGITSKQAPLWETPEQWEKRTGEPLPDDWPVFFEYGENTNYWQIERFGRVKNERVLKIGRICVFAEFGPPPDDWKPEGEKGE